MPALSHLRGRTIVLIAVAVYGRGVRNGTGLAVAPDGAVWTAVNNRDNIAYPYNRDYTGDGRSDRGTVITGYVRDHPLEPLAKLTPGRDLGWPYCNPDRTRQALARCRPDPCDLAP